MTLSDTDSRRPLFGRIADQVPVSITLAVAYGLGLLALGVIAAAGFSRSTQDLISELADREAKAHSSSIGSTVHHALLVEAEATLRGIAESATSVIHSSGWIDETQGAAAQIAEIGNYLDAIDISETGYMYLLDRSGVLLHHPFEELVGSNISAADVYQQIRSVETGFIRYDWANPGETEPREKIAYSVSVPQLQAYVVASDYTRGLPTRLSPGRLSALVDGLTSESVPSIAVVSPDGASTYASVGDRPDALGLPGSSAHLPFLTNESLPNLNVAIEAVFDPMIYGDLLTQMSRAASIWSIGGILWIVLLSVVLGRAISRPLQRLGDAMKELAPTTGVARQLPVVSLGGLVRSQMQLIKDIKQEHFRRTEAEDLLSIAETAFMRSVNGICVTDAEGTIIRVNPAFERVTGYSAEEAIGQNPRLLISGRHEDVFYSDLWDALLTDGTWSGEIWNRRKNGEAYPELLSIAGVKDASGTTDKYVAVFHDLSSMYELQKKLEVAASQDPLTQLPNRQYFTVAVTQALRRSHADNRTIAVILLEVDRIDDIIDSYGHGVADRLLQWVAARLSLELRGDDIAASFSGSQFAVMLNDVEGIGQVPRIAQRIRQAVNEPYEVGDSELRPSISVGIALSPPSGNDSTTLLKNANAALHAARHGGPEEFRIHDPAMNTLAHRRVEMQSRIGRAIAEEEIAPLFQPILTLGCNKVQGVEALARWRHGGRVVPPSEFLPHIDSTSAITDLDLWILEASLSTVCSSSVLPEDFYVTFNAAPVDLTNPRFADIVLSTVARIGCLPERVRMEVTEAAAVRDFDAARSCISQLRDAGVAVYLDDFGEGYSSIRYLREFGVDAVKLDRSYIRDVGSSDSARSLVSGFIQLVHGIGLRTVVEGVESAEHLEFLRGAGADCAQGYLIGKPTGIEEVEALVTG